MKKVLLFTLALVIFLGSTCVASAETFIVTTESDPLNIRLAEDHSQVLGIIRKGKTLKALYTDNYWAYFYYKGKLACAYKSFLTPASSYSSAPGPEAPETVKPTKSSSKSKALSTDLASKIYVVKDTIKNYLTVRDAKSTSAYALGKLYPGDILYVVYVGREWTRVIYNGQYGFVLNKYIEEFAPNLPSEGELYRVSVPDGTNLNVREKESTSSKVLRKILDTAYVKVIERGEKWSKVYYSNNDIGYVMNKFIVPVE